MTSDKSRFWRKNPSDKEANLVVAGMTLGAGLGLAIIYYYSIVLRGSLHEPRHMGDMRDVINDPCNTTVLAMPGALKSADSFYSTFLSDKDIRLLVLHPGRFDDEVHVHMEHVTLGTQHPNYEALSYTWGNQSKTGIIRNYDKDILVTPNLHSALRYLRLEDRDRVLWVDALCIDQGDVDERNCQVRLMGNIFSEADRVIVWLGEERPATRTAFASLEALDLNHRLHEDYTGVGYERQMLWLKDDSGRGSDRGLFGISTIGLSNIMYDEMSRNLSEVYWYAINDLLQQAWFHRLWVIQEISHAQRAIVVSGNAIIPWSTLARACLYMQEHDLTRYLDQSSYYACRIVNIMEKMRAQKHRRSLFDVVLTNAYGGCTEPSDKIFAVMSISDGRDMSDWEFSFNYNLPTYELFKRFAIWDIVRNRSLRVLACASAGPRNSEIPPPLPSWVPDWSRLMDQNVLVRCRSTSDFAASGNTQRDVRFSHNKERMHVKGAVVDSIRIVGSAPYFVKTTSSLKLDERITDQLVLMNDWLRECWNIAGAGRPMTRTIYEEFWKTMLCGLTWSGHPVPEAYSRYFRRYLVFVRQAPKALETFLKNPQAAAVTHPFVRTECLRVPLEHSYTETRSVEFYKWFHKHRMTNSLIEDSLQRWSARKRFCRTEDGRLARVPENAAPGDSICILHGAEVPYVLRLQEDGTFTVIGECYVHGIMHGEALDLSAYRPQILSLR